MTEKEYSRIHLFVKSKKYAQKRKFIKYLFSIFIKPVRMINSLDFSGKEFPVLLKRFYNAVVRRRKAVLAVFALVAVLCVFAMRQVQVDYDINDYLPPDSPSTIAIEKMNSAFTGGIPNMRVMVRDVTVPEALDYKQKLAAIDGVASVTWLDDSLDVTVPLQMQDTAAVES